MLVSSEWSPLYGSECLINLQNGFLLLVGMVRRALLSDKTTITSVEAVQAEQVVTFTEGAPTSASIGTAQ